MCFYGDRLRGAEQGARCDLSQVGSAKKSRRLPIRPSAFSPGRVYLASFTWATRLGLYRALSESGPSTSAQRAAKTGLHERWVREWLHGQASAGLVRTPVMGASSSLSGVQHVRRRKRWPGNPRVAGASRSTNDRCGRLYTIRREGLWQSTQFLLRGTALERAMCPGTPPLADPHQQRSPRAQLAQHAERVGD